MTVRTLALLNWTSHITIVTEQQKYRVQIRQYPRAAGTTWRWWVFDGRGGTHLDTGVIVGSDRVAAERAATAAIEGLTQQWPLEGTTSSTPRVARLESI